MGTLTYSTQEVQAKLDSINQIDAKFATIPRPNLLDNWYFVGGGSQQGGGKFPINQRGSSNYTIANGLYSLDRWKVSGNASSANPETISLQPGYVSASCNVAAGIYQVIENFAELAGKTVTFSMLAEVTSGQYQFSLNDGEYHVIKRAYAGDGKTLYYGTLDVSASPSKFYAMIDGNGTNISIKIYAVKLELGETQTLAHQENGVWVLNEIPNYQQEQEKCQRYQLELVPPGNSAIGCVGGGTPTSTTQCYVFVPTPTELRTVPTRTYAGTWKLVREGTAPASGAAVSAMSVVNRSANGVTLQITSSGLSTSYRYDLWYTAADTTNKLLLSANL